MLTCHPKTQYVDGQIGSFLWIPGNIWGGGIVVVEQGGLECEDWDKNSTFELLMVMWLCLSLQISNNHLHYAKMLINSVPSPYVFPPEVEFGDGSIWL